MMGDIYCKIFQKLVRHNCQELYELEAPVVTGWQHWCVVELYSFDRVSGCAEIFE